MRQGRSDFAYKLMEFDGQDKGGKLEELGDCGKAFG
jgi:hypothetical protein